MAFDSEISSLKPEERARKKIDEQLVSAGWHITDRDHFTPDRNAVALREGLLNGNKEADYLLFLDGKIIGVLEAKRADIDLEAAAGAQAIDYIYSFPDEYPIWQGHPKVVMLANGEKTMLKRLHYRQGEKRYDEIPSVLTPAQCVEMTGIPSYWAKLPELSPQELASLRACQIEAITHLETSFRKGMDKALLVLATGAGKTYTACTAAYRLLTHTPAKRILFLVDRNNLGNQALNEFMDFKLTATKDAFSNIYVTEKLTGKKPGKKTNVVISTIQRLYATLTGIAAKSDEEEDAEDKDLDESVVMLEDRELELPRDYFDVIIIDECHRSIYGRWKSVLEYFNTARFIGLTATPSPETFEFFDKNTVVNYTYEKSIADGVNVDCQVYRIKTKSTTEGVEVEAGEEVNVITRKTGLSEKKVTDKPKHFDPEELDRSIIQPDQIRQVLTAYKKAVYTDLYVDDLYREPDMASLPKTLIFAKSEDHARRIVEIAKEVFAGQSEDFVKTITYSAGDPQKLIREFRTSKTFRIAVTVTLVATGTDVKPLEVVMFMRDVNSRTLFTQMKGRGCRTINPDQLKAVTPNSNGKDQFFLIDAVGVTEHQMNDSPDAVEPIPEVKRSLTLRQLLEKLSYGIVSDDNLRLLASRLSRLAHKITDEEDYKFFSKANFYLGELAEEVYSALEDNELPEFKSASESNLERKTLIEKLINNLEAREYLLELNAGYVIVQKDGKDEIIEVGFSIEAAKDVLESFEAFLKVNPTNNAVINAVKTSRDFKFDYGALNELKDDARRANVGFNCKNLWESFAIVRSQDVVKLKTPEEREAITNYLALTRFGLHKSGKLFSLMSSSQHFSPMKHFELWKGQLQRGKMTSAQIDVMSAILPMILANGEIDRLSLVDTQNVQLLAEGVSAYGNKDRFDAELKSLSSFFLKAI